MAARRSTAIAPIAAFTGPGSRAAAGGSGRGGGRRGAAARRGGGGGAGGLSDGCRGRVLAALVLLAREARAVARATVLLRAQNGARVPLALVHLLCEAAWRATRVRGRRRGLLGLRRHGAIAAAGLRAGGLETGGLRRRRLVAALVRQGSGGQRQHKSACADSGQPGRNGGH